VSELITQQYRDYFSIIDVRISNVYGPTRLCRSDIVPSLIWNLLENGEASVWNKAPRRDFIFVEDAVGAVLKLLESSYSGPINLGSGISSSVEELCACLEDLSGISISNQDIPVSGHMIFCQDISLIKSIIDWEPKFNLEKGLTKTFSEMKLYAKSRL